MTFPEIVLDLRVQVERLLPGWKVWAGLDVADFQFFGWKGSIKNCVQSMCYDIRNIPKAEDVAMTMRAFVEYANRVKDE